MPIPSPHADVEIPDTALSPFVFARTAERGDKPALVDVPTGRALSFGELERQARRLAAGLMARGFGKGDTLAVFMPNLPEYAVAFHGTVLTGGTVTTINPVYNAEEVAFQLQDAGARFLVTIPQALEAARSAAQRSGIEEVFVVGEADGIASLSALMEDEPLDED